MEARGLIQVRYGHPNDEAWDGHPLFAHGLDSFPAGAEVLDSPWLAEVNAANRVAFPGYTIVCRHFALPFKETMVELLCDTLRAHPADRDRVDELARLARFAAEHG